jgi:pimeloyl-ACP methyl ester carboxylesterase
MKRRLAVVVAVALAAGLPVPAPAHAETAPSAGPFVPQLRRCKGVPDARCGTVTRPLDPARPRAGTVDVFFELHKATARPNNPAGTIVAVEGGPGYATTASRDYYLDLFTPLRDTHQLLLVDNRGTGRSAAINCPELQSYEGNYVRNVRLCTEQLGRNSDVWGTAFAVADMVAVLDRLGIAAVDLYGDSYGSFFAQAFAVRHPDRLRTVVLDATYPVADQNPLYPDLNRAIVRAFKLVCQRDLGCRALGGSPIRRLRRLADALAARPLTGRAPTADGEMQTIKVGAPMLAYLAAVATYGTPVYRELDAAGRAYRERGDPLPLLRIASEQNVPGGAGPVRDFSEGLYVAAICNDYPQLWDIDSPRASRQAQYNSALRRLRRTDPDAFAPFTINEWLVSPWTEYRSCIKWRRPSDWVPPVPQPPTYPDVPVLVLAGDLDSITSAEGARIVAGNFPDSTFVEVANMVHVAALADYSRCTSDIVVRFVTTGGDAGDTSCARRYNEVRTVEEFPRRLAEVTPARGAGRGRRAKVVTAAVQTVGDMTARWWSMFGEEGVGLRGGTFTTTALDRPRFTMRDLAWVEDLQVSGRVRWDRTTGAASATLRLSGAMSGRLSVTWNDWDRHAKARVRGRVAGRRVDVSIDAP